MLKFIFPKKDIKKRVVISVKLSAESLMALIPDIQAEIDKHKEMNETPELLIIENPFTEILGLRVVDLE